MRSKRHWLGLVVTVVLLVALMPASASAQEAIALNPSQGPPGTEVTVTGSGWVPGHSLSLLFTSNTPDGINVSFDATVADDGTFSTSFTVPDNAPAGNYTVAAEDSEEGVLVTEGFQVTQPAEEPPEDGPCSDLFFIGVHGVNEDAMDENLFMGDTIHKFYNDFFHKRIPGDGSVEATGVPYPTNTLLELLREAALADKVVPNVQQGVNALEDIVQAQVDECGDQDIILAGFSEGAWVINEFLEQEQELASHLAAIVVFGDPQFDGCPKDKPKECSPFVRRSTNGEGVVPELKPNLAVDDRYLPVPGDLGSNTVSYCLSEFVEKGIRNPAIVHDPVCNWKVYDEPGKPNERRDPRCFPLVRNTCVHNSYDELSIMRRAANFLETQLFD